MRLLCLAAFLLLISFEARAGGCTAQREIVKKDDYGTYEMVRYLCSANPGKEPPLLRISFFRFDEGLAGSIITHTPLPEFESAFGAFEAIENDVTAAAKSLFEGFGGQINYDFAMSNVSWSIKFNGDTLLQKLVEDDDADNKKKRKKVSLPSQPRQVRFLKSNSFALNDSTIVLKEISSTILNTTRWPSGYKFAYDACDGSFIACTTLWRYISASDFDLLLQDMREFARGGSGKQIVPDYERNFRLYAYLGQQGMPSDFLSIYTNLELGCGGDGWNFNYSGRPLKFGAAIIENLTDRPIHIEDFRGLATAAGGLRPSGATASTPPSTASLNLPARTLGPHARVLLPLQISFGPASTRAWDIDGANGTYANIRNSKDKVFEQKVQVTPRKSYTVRKAKDSFREPEIPSNVEYLFGPELSLTGLVADGQEFSLQRAVTAKDKDKDKDAEPTDTVDLSLSVDVALPASSSSGGQEEGISCPILFIWSEGAGYWIAAGKVLHQANGADREMTEVIPLPRLQTHFRLVEQEPETSYIKDARLRLTLSDARQIELRPRQAYSRIIHAYTSIDIDFDLPDTISRDDVVASEMVLTGYYQRYNPNLSLIRNGSKNVLMRN
jgi:hypothetical protein